MTFMLGTEIVGFELFRADGVVGLGPGKGNSTNLIQALHAANPTLIPKPMYSISLANLDENDSDIWFGGVNYDHLRSIHGP
jgi:hypothetical protein